MILYAVYGTGGFAREVLPIAAEKLRADGAPFELCFVEDSPTSTDVNGYQVVSFEELCSREVQEKRFNVAVSDPVVREDLSGKCIENGLKPFNIVAMNSVSYDSNSVGAGAILCANTVITSNAKIGRFFHANIFSYVAHDCVIGDFVTFAPNVHCNGNVRIEDHCYIGTGACLRQGVEGDPLVIGAGAIVGMGAVVTKNVASETVVVGNPAKPLDKPLR